jgi:DNA-binding transcriptional LysR family regulator
MDRFVALQAFVAVAEARSFSEAARKLRLAKSAISRQISDLEADLGVRLFHRTTRSLSLTDAGRGYFERAERILADLADANRAVSHLQASPRGRLRVSAPMSFGFLHLAPALGDFLGRYPDVTVDVAMNDRFVDLVEEGFDVAVRIATLPDSSLIARRLAGPSTASHMRKSSVPQSSRRAPGSRRPEGPRLPVLQQSSFGARLAVRRS